MVGVNVDDQAASAAARREYAVEVAAGMAILDQLTEAGPDADAS